MLNNNQEKTKNMVQEDVEYTSSCVLRKCCACGKLADRKDLIRIMSEHQTGEIIINPNTKQFGRSIYICKNSGCLQLAKKKKRLKGLSDAQIQMLERNILP